MSHDYVLINPIKHSSEYGAFWKCIHAGMIYMFTQLCKMLILATFFPDSDSDLGSNILGVSKLFSNLKSYGFYLKK